MTVAVIFLKKSSCHITILDRVVDYNIWLSQVDANKLIEAPCRHFYCEPLFSKVKANVYSHTHIYISNMLVRVEWAERKKTPILKRNLRKKEKMHWNNKSTFTLVWRSVFRIRTMQKYLRVTWWVWRTFHAFLTPTSLPRKKRYVNSLQTSNLDSCGSFHKGWRVWRSAFRKVRCSLMRKRHMSQYGDWLLLKLLTYFLSPPMQWWETPFKSIHISEIHQKLL